MIKRFFQIREQNVSASLVLFAVRIVMGIAFIYHGWAKMQNPFGWIPTDAAMHIPPFFQFLAAITEFAGGIALTIGALTALVTLGYIVVMLVATYSHLIVFKDPFVTLTGGNSYELALIYLAIALMFTVIGPGKISFDFFVFGEKNYPDII